MQIPQLRAASDSHYPWLTRSYFRWVHNIQARLTSNTQRLALWLPKDAQGQSRGKLMDCACGNGFVSKVSDELCIYSEPFLSLVPRPALSAYFTSRSILTNASFSSSPDVTYHHFAQCVGIELADNMLAEYNATAHDLGLSSSQMTTIQGNLSTADTVDFSSANPHLAVKRLLERLQAPGGVLLIIDWATRVEAGEGIVGADHLASHTESHNSFTREQTFGLFAGVGCGEAESVQAKHLSDILPPGMGRCSWARATRL